MPITCRQCYETTVYGNDTNLPESFGAKILIIPTSALTPDWNSSLAHSRIPSEIDSEFGGYHQSFADFELKDVLRQVLLHAYGHPSLNKENQLEEFIFYLMAARIVPFESSPLEGNSLATIVASAGKIGLGGTVGLITCDGSPFALITVPLGIILVGAANSFAYWLHENREKIWNKIFGFRSSHTKLRPDDASQPASRETTGR